MSEQSDFSAVLEDARARGIRTVDLQFTDIFGNIKFKTVSFDEFVDEREYLKGYGVDGSSINGYGVPVEESDLIIMPDPATFRCLPWAADVARVICDVRIPSADGAGAPFDGDSRSALRRVLAQMPDVLREGDGADRAAFEYHVATELEFFVLDRERNPVDQLGYFDAPTAKMRHFLTEVMEAMNRMGIRYEVYHHEVAPSQFEFDFRYGEALEIADATVTLKDIIHNYAEHNALLATFMPKPFFNMNGSGMHCHFNLSRYTSHRDGKRDKTNLFHDGARRDLSETGLHFIGGLLAHAPALTAVTNPTCNSYKRLVPGWEAPVNIAWGRKNRTALIRVPHGNPRALRCEYRSPDPSCNPYLAFAATLAAGLDGIRRRTDPGAAVEHDLFHGAQETPTLPGSLDAALDCLEADPVVRDALGGHILANFLDAKRAEARTYHARPSNVDFDMYLDV
ncbi:MAG: glutamine synthetase [Lentisphaerae bacterium]|nr:glutamine synthetase [Lentisphaerota bacterium]